MNTHKINYSLMNMNTHFFSILCYSVLISFSACQSKTPKTIPGLVYQFDLEQIVKNSTLTYKWINSMEFGEKVLFLSVGEENNELVLTTNSEGIEWKAAKYIVCEVWHENRFSALLNLQFYRKRGSDLAGTRQGEEDERQTEGPRIQCNTGIMPNLKTKMVFPLNNLDGQQVNLTRYPPQMKSVAVGRRIDPEEVGKVALRINPCEAPDYLPTIQIAAVYLTSELPEPYEKPVALVDSFGQWTARDWPGKIHSSQELKSSMAKTAAIAASATFPDDWSDYGGWKHLRFTPKGFFYTHHDGRRWWFVDPEGYAFLSAGITGILSSASGVLGGQEDLFSWLPPANDELYTQAFQEGRGRKSVDFLRINLMRVYGSEWKQKWEELAVGLMKHWRVNTVANWSDVEMARRHRIPYMLNLSRYPSTQVRVYRDFPDVFDPAYLEAAKTFAEQLRPIKDDPYLIGYFLANEPGWAFGGNNIAFEMFATDLQSFTKKEMIKWLQKKYRNNLNAFNDAWNIKLNDFNALEKFTMRDRPSEIAWNDCYEFSELMVDCYIQTVCKEVKKVDPNHLNLGLRYASIHSDLHYRAGEWFDVFSINGYRNPAPPATDEITRRTGLPVLIGEWHFGSVDHGLPATGIQAAESQKARGVAYRYYVENGFARPELIAVHWFQWNDQPIFGRGDGENYNIGFLDICNQPYTELTESAKLSHERMYLIATSSEHPFDQVIRKVPKIAY